MNKETALPSGWERSSRDKRKGGPVSIFPTGFAVDFRRKPLFAEKTAVTSNNRNLPAGFGPDGLRIDRDVIEAQTGLTPIPGNTHRGIAMKTL